MRIIAWIVINTAWFIPGPPHRWARQLMAECKAGREALTRWKERTP
jgi:hypothetical protein